MMPSTLVGTPLMSCCCGGTICTYRSGTAKAAVFNWPNWVIGMGAPEIKSPLNAGKGNLVELLLDGDANDLRSVFAFEDLLHFRRVSDLVAALIVCERIDDG